MDRDGNVIHMTLQPRDGRNNLWAERCAQITETFKFLKDLDIGEWPWKDTDIPTINLLQGLPHLESLSIYGTISLVRIFILNSIICSC